MLNIPRSTYYQSKHQTESKWKHENEQLLERIKEIYFESKRRYGAIKDHRQLLKEGFFSKFETCSTINETSWISFNYSKEI